MALIATNWKHVSYSLTSIGSRTRRISNSSCRSSSPLEYVFLMAPAQCRIYSTGSPSAGLCGCSVPSPPTPKFGLLGQFAPIFPSARRAALCSAEEVAMALPGANCFSELDPVLEQVSVPTGIIAGFAASVMTIGGGLWNSAENLVRGDFQVGGRGGSEVGGENVGAGKDLLRLGCALVTPGCGAASASGDWWSQYVPGMQDIFAGIVTLACAVALIQTFNELAKRDVLDKKLSRKLVHIGVGLGFMPFWALFTTSRIAPYLAAVAPALNTLRLGVVGLGLVNNEAFVKSMTREGDRRELLKGPLYYGLAVVVTTLGFWRTSPVGIVALCNLCVGDGFADIIGRKFGRVKLPYNQNKSIAGTVGFFITASLASILYLSYFAAFGFLKILPGTFLGVVIVAFCTAVVESLPISTHMDDNFTVPFTSIVLGMLLLPVC